MRVFDDVHVSEATCSEGSSRMTCRCSLVPSRSIAGTENQARLCVDFIWKFYSSFGCDESNFYMMK